MPARQIYSRRLWSVPNFNGAYGLVNAGPDLFIVRTVTVYNGGLAQCEFFLLDENNVALLEAQVGVLSQRYVIWPDIRLMWPPGTTWNLSTTSPVDMSGHGYALTP